MKLPIAGFVVASFHLANAQTTPFPFGNITGEIYAGPGDNSVSPPLYLPKPMSFLQTNVTYVKQVTDGSIFLFTSSDFAGEVHVYRMDLDTRNGGRNQNQVALRVGNDTRDSNLARDIIAGTGTLFIPQATVVATWYKVEAKERRVGAQNTFQLIMAYSETGETWVIFAFSQLQFYQSAGFSPNVARVGYYLFPGDDSQYFADVNSLVNMNLLLTSSNCNRKGIYSYRINAGGPTKAPTKVPTKTPTNTPTKAPTMVPSLAPTPAKCGVFGWSIFCPQTLCGVLGRWFGWCKSSSLSQP
jgi:Nidogen-like